MLARLDKVRPALVLTAPDRLGRLSNLTLAPITSTRRGLPTEIAVGSRNGLDHESVVSCDNITTVSTDHVLSTIGVFFDDDEPALRAAIAAAFDLDVE